MIEKKIPLQVMVTIILDGKEMGRMRGFYIAEDSKIEVPDKKLPLFKECGGRERLVVDDNVKYFYVISRFYIENGVGYKEMTYSTEKPL